MLRSGSAAVIVAAALSLANTLPAAAADPILVGAGDIASCSSSGDSATARLLDGIPGTVFTTGDNAYPYGRYSDFIDCYRPTWGRHRSRTRPSAGNHEYMTPGASGYYDYFGWRAGDRRKGYYSYDRGAWHVIVLNSNCSAVGGCHNGSPQERWLRNDLASHRTACTLAYWHHPRFSSGLHGSSTTYQPFWQALYDYRADVVLNGHDHDYERFAPQTPWGTLARRRGIRAFVVGTGGASLRRFGTIQPNSQVRYAGTPGVLKLRLHPTSFAWRFIPTSGTFSDSGRGYCR